MFFIICMYYIPIIVLINSDHKYKRKMIPFKSLVLPYSPKTLLYSVDKKKKRETLQITAIEDNTREYLAYWMKNDLSIITIVCLLSVYLLIK